MKYYVVIFTLLVGCSREQPKPEVIFVPTTAPAPITASIAPAPTKEDLCEQVRSVENDKGCSDGESDGCVFSTSDDSHCVILKKKPTQAELNKWEKERSAKFDRVYCKKMYARVNEIVTKANMYEARTDDVARQRPTCYSRMRQDHEAIRKLRAQVDSIENNNRWRLGSSHASMSMALSESIECLSCASQSSNRIGCSDMREDIRRVNCNEP